MDISNDKLNYIIKVLAIHHGIDLTPDELSNFEQALDDGESMDEAIENYLDDVDLNAPNEAIVRY